MASVCQQRAGPGPPGHPPSPTPQSSPTTAPRSRRSSIA
jgi:hypothetical protein